MTQEEESCKQRASLCSVGAMALTGQSKNSYSVKTSWKLFPMIPPLLPHPCPVTIHSHSDSYTSFCPGISFENTLSSSSRHPSLARIPGYLMSFPLVLSSLNALTFCRHLPLRARKNSKWFSPLLVEPPPGFSQEPGKEERNHYLRNTSEVPRTPHT